MADDFKTPSQLAEDTKHVGRDAAQAANGIANEAKSIGADAAQSLRPAIEDAKATGREAVDTANGVARDAKEIASDAAETTRNYASGAVNAAGKKITDLKHKAADLQDASVRYVGDEPVKSVLIAAAGGALLTALFIKFIGGGRRY